MSPPGPSAPSPHRLQSHATDLRGPPAVPPSLVHDSAVRYGREKLGAREGFFAGLVDVVVAHFGGFFPEVGVLLGYSAMQ